VHAVDVPDKINAVRTTSGCFKVALNPFAGIEPVRLSGAEEIVAQLKAFLASETAYDAGRLRAEAPDGTYTWLIYSRRDDPTVKRFVAKEVKTPWELGTRHQAIACDPTLGILGGGRVFGGGELVKAPYGVIHFNLLSGTFTRALMRGKRPDEQGHIEEALQVEFRRLVPGPLNFEEAIIDDTLAASFLTYAPVPDALLEGYRRFGFVFEPADPAECATLEAESAKNAAAIAAAKAGRRKPNSAPSSPVGGVGGGGGFASPGRKSRKRRNTRRRRSSRTIRR
jgi:hypothetical protein